MIASVAKELVSKGMFTVSVLYFVTSCWGDVDIRRMSEDMR